MQKIRSFNVAELLLPPNIWLTGQMGAGKDFAANALVKWAGFTRLSLADALKEELCAHHSITLDDLAQRKAEFRSRLQEWGRAQREADLLYWVKEWQKRRDAIAGPVVCADMRFPNEAEYALARGFFSARIETPAAVRETRLRARDGKFDPSWLNHESEVHIPHLPVHCRIDGEMPELNYIFAFSGVYRQMVEYKGEMAA
jgi:hypothetical protein